LGDVVERRPLVSVVGEASARLDDDGVTGRRGWFGRGHRTQASARHQVGRPARWGSREAVGSRPMPTRTLSEAESKKLLSRTGVPFAPERVVASVDDAVRAAEELGHPVVVKLNG